MKIAITVLVLGLIGILVAPFLFTRKGFVSFTQTGHIGDTIGGITAPISSLVGSILVFLALRAQLMANKVTREQINAQQTEEKTRREVAYVSELYKHFSASIQNYETKYFRGYKAITKMMSLLARREQENAHENGLLYYGTTAELYAILKSGKLFLEQVRKSRIEDHDKHYFRDLLKYHYDSFIVPYLTKNTSTTKCEICGEMHNGLPIKISQVIDETVYLFQQIVPDQSTNYVDENKHTT